MAKNAGCSALLPMELSKESEGGAKESGRRRRRRQRRVAPLGGSYLCVRDQFILFTYKTHVSHLFVSVCVCESIYIMYVHGFSFFFELL